MTQFPVPKDPAELLGASCSIPISFVQSRVSIEVTGACGLWWLTGDFLWIFCCSGTGGEGLPVWVSVEQKLSVSGEQRKLLELRLGPISRSGAGRGQMQIQVSEGMKAVHLGNHLREAKRFICNQGAHLLGAP